VWFPKPSFDAVVVLGLMATRASSLAKLPLSRHLAAFTFPADISAKALMVYTSLFLSSNVPMQVRLMLAPALMACLRVAWLLGQAFRLHAPSKPA
jgi:hypothetical protein